MSILQYLVIGFAPGVFWLWFFHRKDDLEPEPRWAVLRVFALGVMSALLVEVDCHLEPLTRLSGNERLGFRAR